MIKLGELFFSRMFLVVAISAVTGFGAVPSARASGLDVQLKDLRGAFYHLDDAKPAAKSTCPKLTYPEIKKYGRLTHCRPEDDYVECHTKGDETLLVFEALDACNRSLNKANAKEP